MGFLLSAVLTTLASLPQAPALGDSAQFSERPWHHAERWSGPPPVETEDVLAAARAHISAQRFAEARALLRTVLEREDSEATPITLTLLAHAELQLGRHVEAARALRAARADGRAVGHGRLAALEGSAWERGGDSVSAQLAYRTARLQLRRIDDWLRIRQARVTSDTAQAFALLADLDGPAARTAAQARIALRLAAGDSAGAFLEAVLTDDRITAVGLALATGEHERAAALLFEMLRESPDKGAPVVRDVLATYQTKTAEEQLLAASGLAAAGALTEALAQAEGARDDSTTDATFLIGELSLRLGQYARAEAAFAEAARLGGGDRAILARAQALQRTDRDAARELLADLAEHSAESGIIARALLLLGEVEGGTARYEALARLEPSRREASTARWRLIETALDAGDLEGARGWLAAEVVNGREQARAAFWQGKVSAALGDSTTARQIWQDLGRRDSLGYYGTVARERAGLPAVAFMPSPAPVLGREARRFFARLDDLLDVGFVQEAETEVAWLLEQPADSQTVLDFAEGLIERGFVPEGVQLGWRASSLMGLNDPRVVRSIWPLPRRGAVTHEAAEFGLDAFVLAALVYAESRFDTAAVSRSGARGLTQLMPGTARGAAQRLGIAWQHDWVEVSDLNLHLGSSHLAGLMRTYDGELRLALAAYNAGGGRVRRWLRMRPFTDPDRWVEQIPFAETRGYVRGVLRNLVVYRALYGAPRAAS